MNSQGEQTGLPAPPTSCMKGLKPADRRKTYLITSAISVSILSTREEVPQAHRVEVGSRALTIVVQFSYLPSHLPYHVLRMLIIDEVTSGSSVFYRKGRHQHKIIQIDSARIITIGNKKVVFGICGIKTFLGNTCMWLKSFNQAFPGGQYIHMVENKAFPSRQYMYVVEQLQPSISRQAIHAGDCKASIKHLLVGIICMNKLS